MNIKNFVNMMITAKETYPITEAFIENNRQKSGGYLAYASKIGLKAPSQRWHFLDSYIIRSLLDDSLHFSDDAGVMYRRLRCPELLLWLCEASGVKSSVVRLAADKADRIINSGIPRARVIAAQEIKNVIPFDFLEQALISK